MAKKLEDLDSLVKTREISQIITVKNRQVQISLKLLMSNTDRSEISEYYINKRFRLKT